MKKHIMFLHVWKAINHTIILALSYFRYFFLLLTYKYLPHTVLDCQVIDPEVTTSLAKNIPFYSSFHRFL